MEKNPPLVMKLKKNWLHVHWAEVQEKCSIQTPSEKLSNPAQCPMGHTKSLKTFIGRSGAGGSGQQEETSPCTAVLAWGRCNLSVIGKVWAEQSYAPLEKLFCSLVNIGPSWDCRLSRCSTMPSLSLLQPPPPCFLPLLAKNRAVKESSSKGSLASVQTAV